MITHRASDGSIFGTQSTETSHDEVGPNIDTILTKQKYIWKKKMVSFEQKPLFIYKFSLFK